jgi:hypothetical protein
MSNPFGDDGEPQSSMTLDYLGDSAQGAAQLSNVAFRPAPQINPAYKGNFGRKAAMMGNWRNPVQGQGTFFTQDDESPTEIPQSDTGSEFAKDRY